MHTQPPDIAKMIVTTIVGHVRALLSNPYAWVGIGIIALVFAMKWFDRWQEHRRLAAAGMDEVDQMTGKDFEKFLEVVFKRSGYSVERIQYIGDYGADLVLVKDGVRTVVQAKRWNRTVGIKAVQEVVASKGKYKCTEAVVVTNSTYTQQAVELARANDVRLWNREDLIKARLEMRGETRTEALQPAPLPEAAYPPEGAQTAVAEAVCATCGKPVTEKVRQYCADHPARFTRQVYCFEHQKVVRTNSGGRPGGER